MWRKKKTKNRWYQYPHAKTVIFLSCCCKTVSCKGELPVNVFGELLPEGAITKRGKMNMSICIARWWRRTKHEVWEVGFWKIYSQTQWIFNERTHVHFAMVREISTHGFFFTTIVQHSHADQFSARLKNVVSTAYLMKSNSAVKFSSSVMRLGVRAHFFCVYIYRSPNCNTTWWVNVSIDAVYNEYNNFSLDLHEEGVRMNIWTRERKDEGTKIERTNEWIVNGAVDKSMNSKRMMMMVMMTSMKMMKRCKELWSRWTFVERLRRVIIGSQSKIIRISFRNFFSSLISSTKYNIFSFSREMNHKNDEG